MTPPANSERYTNHRFSGEIISPGVWLYDRFPLSYRDVQELLCERGINVTHEAICQWCLKFGQDYANQLQRRRPRPGDKWHLDEVFLMINSALRHSDSGHSPNGQRVHPLYEALVLRPAEAVGSVENWHEQSGHNPQLRGIFVSFQGQGGTGPPDNADQLQAVFAFLHLRYLEVLRDLSLRSKDCQRAFCQRFVDAQAHLILVAN
jgi:hypothetical protein